MSLVASGYNTPTLETVSAIATLNLSSLGLLVSDLLYFVPPCVCYKYWCCQFLGNWDHYLWFCKRRCRS